MIDFIDIENTSLPPFCVVFGRIVEVVEEAGQSLPPRCSYQNWKEKGCGGWAKSTGLATCGPAPLSHAWLRCVSCFIDLHATALHFETPKTFSDIPEMSRNDPGMLQTFELE